MLEARIMALVPAPLMAARLIIMFAVALVVLDAWHAFNMPAWLQSDSGRSMIAMIIRVAIILLIAAFTWTVVASIIENRLSSIQGRTMPREPTKPLLAVFRHAALKVILPLQEIERA